VKGSKGKSKKAKGKSKIPAFTFLPLTTDCCFSEESFMSFLTTHGKYEKQEMTSA
jgi:hypothetical protein